MRLPVATCDLCGVRRTTYRCEGCGEYVCTQCRRHRRLHLEFQHVVEEHFLFEEEVEQVALGRAPLPRGQYTLENGLQAHEVNQEVYACKP